MMTKEENELLCRVEGDAAMGQLMRRHWLPICLTEEVPEPDCDPVRARILGENLVAFRDSKGRVGVMNERCPHRGASLFYGRNEECGLRCLYHGWKMDVDGNVLEMVSEPPSSDLPKKVHHRAYKTHEWAGIVWGYLGPQDQVPEFVPPPWAPTADVRVSIAKVVVPCNWAQILEGNIDSSHSSSLHSSDMVPARVSGSEATDKKWLRPSTDKCPRLQVQHTPYGFRYAAIRRPITKASETDYIRSTVFIAPSSALIPPNNRYNVANFNVPIDDTHTVFHFIAWGDPLTTPDTETWRRFLGQSIGSDLDPLYRPFRNADNHFWQDRQAMRAGNFTGIKGFPNQDLAMWTSLGPIADRTEETLAAGDLAVVEFRNTMIKAAQDFQAGQPAIGTGANHVKASVCSFQAILPKDIDWRTYDAKPVLQGEV
ncbi:Phthalate 4,5-dioxygenase oxygenase subunit [Castellaniella defragrans]